MIEGRILVVEDDPKTADLLRRYLEHGGFDVTVSFNGTQALEDFTAEPPDLVVLDEAYDEYLDAAQRSPSVS